MSLFEWDLLQPARFVGLDNFRELVGVAFKASLRNSLTRRDRGAAARGDRARPRAADAPDARVGAERAGVFFPTVIPDVAYALLWLWILNPLFGPLNLLLGALGLPTPSWLSVPASARWGVVIMGLFLIGKAS